MKVAARVQRTNFFQQPRIKHGIKTLRYAVAQQSAIGRQQRHC